MSSLQISLVSALFVLHSFIPTSRGKNLIQPVHFEEKMRTLLTEGLGVSDMQVPIMETYFDLYLRYVVLCCLNSTLLSSAQQINTGVQSSCGKSLLEFC